jgi:glycosyltransferase involved in cell wall biosynthesis
MNLPVSFCMIVKNEAENLPEALESIRDISSEIIVVDTGSVDNTREIALNYGAKVYDFTWIDDFSAARNYSLQFPTQEWIFIFDADFRLKETAKTVLEECTRNKNISLYYIQIIAETGLQHPLINLFRNNLGIRFEGRIHEQLVFDKNKHAIAFSGIYLEHNSHSHSEISAGKLARNKAILERELQEENLPEAKKLRLEIYLLRDEIIKMPEEKENYHFVTEKIKNLVDRIENSPNLAVSKLLYEAFLIECLSFFYNENDLENFKDILLRGLKLFPFSLNLLFALSQLFFISGYYFKNQMVLDLLEYLVRTGASACYEFNNRTELLMPDYFLSHKILSFYETGDYETCRFYLEKITEPEKFKTVLKEVIEVLEGRTSLLPELEKEVESESPTAFPFFRLAREYSRENKDSGRVTALYTSAFQLTEKETNEEIKLLIFSNLLSEAAKLNFDKSFLENVIRKGMEIAGKNYFFWFSLGEYYFSINEFSTAIKHYETAYKSWQDETDLVFNRDDLNNKSDNNYLNFLIKQSREKSYFQKCLLNKIKLTLARLT